MKAFFKEIVVTILTFEARVLLRRTRPKIIGITGSVGKTSTKDAIYHAIKTHVHARKNQKSFNTEIGVPLTILGLPNAGVSPLVWLKNIIEGFFIMLFPGKYPDVLVLEMGVERPGDMKYLTSWVRPDIVVLTRLPNVPVHVEFFSTPEAVVEEKLQLVHALAADGILVYNHDDELIRRSVADVRQQAIGYSRYSPSHFTAEGDELIVDGDMPTGQSFYIEHLDERQLMRVRGAIGVQHCYNVAAASAVASLFDVSLAEVAAAMESFTPPPGRMRLIPGLKDTMLLDDTYNSSPIATERALLTLGEVPAKGRKIAILGDMMELGQFSVREHERVGESVPEVADILFTLGLRSRKIAESALEHGMSEKNIRQYDDVERAGRELQNFLEPGDVVLVKASQSIRAERIVKEVMAEPLRAEDLLVRQDAFWQKH